jgi:hypothetical protein
MTLYAQWTAVPKLSSNAKLKSLKKSRGTLSPKFAAGKTSYKLKLNRKQASVKLTPVKSDPKATLQIMSGGKWKTAKSTTVKVARGKSKTVTFRVVAQDKKTTKTYKVKVTRAR